MPPKSRRVWSPSAAIGEGGKSFSDVGEVVGEGVVERRFAEDGGNAYSEAGNVGEDESAHVPPASMDLSQSIHSGGAESGTMFDCAPYEHDEPMFIHEHPENNEYFSESICSDDELVSSFHVPPKIRGGQPIGDFF